MKNRGTIRPEVLHPVNYGNYWNNLRGSVICVQKGLAIHKGILHSVALDGTVYVIDNSPVRGCVAIRTLDEFHGGQPWWFERVALPQDAGWILSRAESQLNRPYDLWNFNCQNFVALAWGQIGQPNQADILKVAVLVGAIVAAVQVLGEIHA